MRTFIAIILILVGTGCEPNQRGHSSPSEADAKKFDSDGQATLLSLSRRLYRLEGRIETLSEALAKPPARMQPDSDGLRSLSKRIGTLENKYSSSSGSSKTPSHDVSRQNDQLRDFGRRLSSLEKRVNSGIGEVSGPYGKLDRLENMLDRCNDKLRNVEDYGRQLRGISREFDDLRRRVRTLERQ